MNIEQIVKFYGGTDTAAARALGVTRERVGFVHRNKHTPPIEWQRQVERESKGKLKADVCKHCGQALRWAR